MLKNNRQYRTWRNPDSEQIILLDELIKEIQLLKAEVEALRVEQTALIVLVTP